MTVSTTTSRRTLVTPTRTQPPNPPKGKEAIKHFNTPQLVFPANPQIGSVILKTASTNASSNYPTREAWTAKHWKKLGISTGKSLTHFPTSHPQRHTDPAKDNMNILKGHSTEQTMPPGTIPTTKKKDKQSLCHLFIWRLQGNIMLGRAVSKPAKFTDLLQGRRTSLKSRSWGIGLETKGHKTRLWANSCMSYKTSKEWFKLLCKTVVTNKTHTWCLKIRDWDSNFKGRAGSRALQGFTSNSSDWRKTMNDWGGKR